jgi:hypothetical protein
MSQSTQHRTTAINTAINTATKNKSNLQVTDNVESSSRGLQRLSVPRSHSPTNVEKQRDPEDKYTSRPFLLTFYDNEIEATFLNYYADTMYARRWIFLLLIMMGVLILLISFGTYDLVYPEGSTLHTIISAACAMIYLLGRSTMAGMICTNPKTSRKKYNVLRICGGICIVLVHVWMIAFIDSDRTIGLKLPVVEAFAALGELIFLGYHFVSFTRYTFCFEHFFCGQSAL